MEHEIDPMISDIWSIEFPGKGGAAIPETALSIVTAR